MKILIILIVVASIAYLFHHLIRLRRYKEIINNYETSTLEEKIWAYCFKHKVVVEIHKTGIFVRDFISFGNYYEIDFSDIQSSPSNIIKYCNFKSLNSLLNQFEKHLSLRKEDTSKITFFKLPKKSVIKKHEDLSHLL
jgi:transcriptional/translational regulatory protein YebC/TACO1